MAVSKQGKEHRGAARHVLVILARGKSIMSVKILRGNYNRNTKGSSWAQEAPPILEILIELLLFVTCRVFTDTYRA